MIYYRNCADVDLSDIYGAFKIGFSDYIIKLDISKDGFVSRFFGAEGNSLKHSFIAFDDERPVGVLLGGIKNYEGTRTIRCGTLCMDPEYRGKGISQGLFELHRSDAVKSGCRQMFLEVIAGNDRAINFYKRAGYEKVYDLSYFTLNNMESLSNSRGEDVEVKEVSVDLLKALRKEVRGVHINWQNDIEYIEKIDGYMHYGVYLNESLAGLISINKGGRLSFLWVDEDHRHRHIGTALIRASVDELGICKINVSFPNNASLEGFLKKTAFEKDKISQYEMYLTL